MTKTFVTTLLALGMLAVAPDASAFCRSTTCRDTKAKACTLDAKTCPVDGAKLFWPTSCVGYAMNQLGTQQEDPTQTQDTIRKSFEAWTNVACPDGGHASITFEEHAPISLKKSEYNKDGGNVNVVFFQDDDWAYRGIDGTLAKTSVTYNDETGEIYDADIEVNSANHAISVGTGKVYYDLQSILTHEAGHFIGIAHSGNGSAVMAPTYSEGTIGQRLLTPDDVEAVCTAYPPDNGVACNSQPRGGFSNDPGGVPRKMACARRPPSGIAVSRTRAEARERRSPCWALACSRS